MKNTIRLRSNYMNMMVNNYINHHNNADSSYMITRTEYDFIKHSEIKLYNNVVKYLQEHTGDFQELYIQLTTKFCEMLLEPINEYGLSDDHSDNIVLYEAIQNQLITPEQIRNVKELVIEPKFNPRQMCKEHIIKLMQDNELLQDIEDQIDDIATKIENACYNHVIQYCRNSDISYQIKWTSNTFIERYQDRISVILNHLNYDSITNQTYDHVVVKKLLSGDLSPEDIGSKEDTELCKEAIAAEINEIDTRNNQKIKEKYSTMFKCPVCKTRRCTYREKQVRSLDEPANIYCDCLNCGTRFQGN